MNRQTGMIGIWSGVGAVAVWGSGLAIAGWLPPMQEGADAQTIAAVVQAHSTRILIGAVIMSVSAAFYLPFTIVLSDIIKKIEGDSYVLSGTQLVAGLMAQMTWFIPPFLWGVAAFRPLRSPDVTQSLLDVGWMMFITGIGPFILEYLAIAIAIFSDKRATPAFPRWVGYLQIWLSISFLPAALPFFFKNGIFCWSGLFVWWLPLSLFTVWFIAMVFYARKAVLREDAPQAARLVMA